MKPYHIDFNHASGDFGVAFDISEERIAEIIDFVLHAYMKSDKISTALEIILKSIETDGEYAFACIKLCEMHDKLGVESRSKKKKTKKSKRQRTLTTVVKDGVMPTHEELVEMGELIAKYPPESFQDSLTSAHITALMKFLEEKGVTLNKMGPKGIANLLDGRSMSEQIEIMKGVIAIIHGDDALHKTEKKSKLSLDTFKRFLSKGMDEDKSE